MEPLSIYKGQVGDRSLMYIQQKRKCVFYTESMLPVTSQGVKELYTYSFCSAERLSSSQR